MWKVDEKGRRILIAPYDDMVTAAIKRESALSSLAKTEGKVYIPVINPGFNNEKIVDVYGWLIKRTNPTLKKFEEFANGVEPLIDPKLNIIFVSSYSEFTEGSTIEPTTEYGFSYIDVIRDKFAIEPAGGWPPNLVPTKNCGCTEYKNWNTEIGIPGIGSLVTAVSENSFLKMLVRRRETLNDKKIYKENLAI